MRRRSGVFNFRSSQRMIGFSRELVRRLLTILKSERPTEPPRRRVFAVNDRGESVKGRIIRQARQGFDRQSFSYSLPEILIDKRSQIVDVQQSSNLHSNPHDHCKADFSIRMLPLPLQTVSDSYSATSKWPISQTLHASSTIATRQ
jgi:hypothetical protein